MYDVSKVSEVAERCIVCGGTESELRFSYHGYPLMRCLDCGLEFVSPTPSAEELARHYQESYAVSLDKYAASKDRNMARLVELERWCPERGQLLEIGAAYGHSLDLARQRGWEVTGVELSSEAAAYARDHFALQVYDCDLIEAPLSNGYFDAAIMWHVLEHSRNPREQAEQVARLLKPGGILGIRVPNIESFGARATGEWWPWMCPPAHLWFFSKRTLPRLLRDCGFEVLEVETLRGDGNNLYQYALIWGGRTLNDLRRRVRGTSKAPDASSKPDTSVTKVATGGTETTSKTKPTTEKAKVSPTGGALGQWLQILKRAQPITNAMARGTRPLIEPLERKGWGDELLVYAKRCG